MSAERLSRVIVTGGPWPSRIGCAGWIVAGVGYPYEKLKGEVVVLLDDDPLRSSDVSFGVPLDAHADEWSCVLAQRDVEAAS